MQIAARLRRSHLLFLGYAVDDWSLRVFLRRVGASTGSRTAPGPSSRPPKRSLASFWRERGVEAYEVGLEGYSESSHV